MRPYQIYFVLRLLLGVSVSQHFIRHDSHHVRVPSHFHFLCRGDKADGSEGDTFASGGERRHGHRDAFGSVRVDDEGCFHLAAKRWFSAIRRFVRCSTQGNFKSSIFFLFRFFVRCGHYWAMNIECFLSTALHYSICCCDRFPRYLIMSGMLANTFIEFRNLSCLELILQWGTWSEL